MTSKKFKYDGRSRPTTDLYKKNFEIIFGKKINKDKEELEGYYIDDKGIKMNNDSYDESQAQLDSSSSSDSENNSPVHMTESRKKFF